MEPKLHFLYWVFLLLLHLQRPSLSSPILKYGCRPGTLKECKEAKFVPGHTLLGEGIDIVTMKTTGSFLFDLQEVDNKCAVCDNPHNKNILQKLPKALVDWRPETSCSKNIQSSVSQSKVSVANDATSTVQNDWRVGLHVKVKVVDAKTAVGGSHSNLAKFAHRKSLTDNYSFLSHKLECSFYRYYPYPAFSGVGGYYGFLKVQYNIQKRAKLLYLSLYYSFGLGSNASLTAHFDKALEQLPNSYDTNTKAQYRRLIANFGTHYITRVKVGGRTQEITAVRTCEVAMTGMKMDEVKDCLDVEAEIGVSDMTKSANTDSKVQHCKNKLQKAQFGDSFHRKFNEYTSEVSGGSATFDLLSTDKATADVFQNWMESLKTHPGLVSYSLDSIHNLVRMKGPKKENLRQAVSDYINEMAITHKCSCPPHHVSHQGNDCSCSCSASKYTSHNCCPARHGVAKLHVTIKGASGLRADYWTQSDAYATFRFDNAGMRTQTIWNNDNPKWNMKYDLGVVELDASKKFTIEVWDEDNFSDEWLGKCEKVLTSGNLDETCYLKRGSVTYSAKVTCVDHLQGLFCKDYIPVPPSV